jgi:NitT/TauT family transport system substrate-binding protein
MDLYSNGMIVSKQLAADSPEVVKGMISAINKGVADTLADLDAAVDSVAAREPLINKEIEKERLIATLQDEMNHPELATTGLGAVDPARFKESIDLVVQADGLPRTPAPEEIFTDAFLPAADDRIYKLL